MTMLAFCAQLYILLILCLQPFPAMRIFPYNLARIVFYEVKYEPALTGKMHPVICPEEAECAKKT